MAELIYNTNNCAWTGTGVKSVKTWLTNDGNVDEPNIRGRPYHGSSGLGIPNVDKPQGLAVVRVRLLASLVCRILLTSNNYSG